MSTIPYSSVMTVVDTWETVKRSPSWNKTFGAMLFDNLFEKSPLSLTILFPFGTKGEKMRECPEFAQTAQQAARTLDLIVSALENNDRDLLECQLQELVREHPKVARVRPEHWDLISKALLETLAETLASMGQWDNQIKESWEEASVALAELTVKLVKA